MCQRMAYICGYDRTTKVNAMDEDCRGDVNGVVVVALLRL
jgi:hypothetical protein